MFDGSFVGAMVGAIVGALASGTAFFNIRPRHDPPSTGASYAFVFMFCTAAGAGMGWVCDTARSGQ